MVRNPFRRRYLVQKFVPEKFCPPSGVGPAFPGWGRAVVEEAPAPAFRRYWRLETAKQVVARLNSGMEAIHAKERFRVIQRP